MKKKLFTNPLILNSFTPFDPGDDNEFGEGSGQSGQEAWPACYSDWLVLFAEDIVGEDGIINSDDYTAWMNEKGWADYIDIDVDDVILP